MAELIMNNLITRPEITPWGKIINIPSIYLI